jgi:hypothetical protein
MKPITQEWIDKAEGDFGGLVEFNGGALWTLNVNSNSL